jgi:hypothetical protein
MAGVLIAELFIGRMIYLLHHHDSNATNWPVEICIVLRRSERWTLSQSAAQVIGSLGGKLF